MLLGALTTHSISTSRKSERLRLYSKNAWLTTSSHRKQQRSTLKFRSSRSRVALSQQTHRCSETTTSWTSILRLSQLWAKQLQKAASVHQLHLSASSISSRHSTTLCSGHGRSLLKVTARWFSATSERLLSLRTRKL